MSESETRQDDSKVFPKSFIRSGALLFGAILFWHLSNFAFNAIGARLLGPTQYGTLAAATALLYVASPFFFSVQTVASRLTTRLYSRSEWDRLHGLLRYYGKRLAAGGLLLAGAVAIGSSALARFLRISSPMPIAILGIAFASSLITHLQRGVLQGSLRFARYAFSTVMEGAVKIVAAVSLLVLVSRDANAAVLAVVISSLLAVAVNWALLGFLPASRTTVPLSQVYRYSLVALSCLLLLAILLSVDLLAAKRYLDPHTAGLYAAISLSGKIVFFATSALAIYLFPFFSERQERGLDSKRTLARAFGVLIATSGLLVAVYFVAPQLVTTPLFGSSYHAANPYIGWMGVAFAAYAVVYLMAMYLLSRESAVVSAVLGVAVLGQIAGLYTFHSTISSIIAVQCVVLVSTAVVLGAFALQTRTVTAPAPEPA